MSRLYDTWGARDWRRYCAFLLGRRLYVSCASLLSGSLCSETVATPVHSSFPGACFAGRYVERRLCGCEVALCPLLPNTGFMTTTGS